MCAACFIRPHALAEDSADEFGELEHSCFVCGVRLTIIVYDSTIVEFVFGLIMSDEKCDLKGTFFDAGKQVVSRLPVGWQINFGCFIN